MPLYFLPNFLSTGLGERFCALWRMLHLASAAAHDKREGGQERVTPRMQRGAELRSSSSLRVCHGAGQQPSQAAGRAGVLRGLAEAWASAPLPDRARCLHGTAIRHGYRHSAAPCTAASPARAQLLHCTAQLRARHGSLHPASCAGQLPARHGSRHPVLCTAPLSLSARHSSSLRDTAPCMQPQVPKR